MAEDRRLLIIDIGVREIRFLEYGKGIWGKPDKVSFETVAAVAEDSDPGKELLPKSWEKELRSYRQGHRPGRNTAVYLLIPFQQGLVREFRLPWLPNKLRDAAVSYWLKQEAPHLAGRLVYDYQVMVEKEKEFLDIRLTAARKEIIEAYAGSMAKAGYILSGIEFSFLAMGEVFRSLRGKRILFLQEMKDKRIQVIFYREPVPVMIAEVGREQWETVKFSILPLSGAEELPLDYALTDGSSGADVLAGLLVQAWIVREKEEALPDAWLDSLRHILPESTKEANERINQWGVGSFSLLGELLRIKNGGCRNLYLPWQRPQKIKTVVFLGAGLLALFVLAGSLVMQPLLADYLKIQQENIVLQERLEQIAGQDKNRTAADWAKSQAVTAQNLRKSWEAVRDLPPEITLTRAAYRDGTMYFWARSGKNSGITAFIGVLVSGGWKDPLLVEYKFEQQKAAFCLSVKRE